MSMKLNQSHAVWMLCAFVGVILVAAGLEWSLRLAPSIQVGTAVVSQTLCGEIFISGLDANRVFAEEIRPRPNFRILLKRLRYQVHPSSGQVVTTWFGHFPSVATYRPGYGCTLGNPESATTAIAPSSAPGAESGALPVVTPPAGSPLNDALDDAFAESAQPPFRQLRQVRAIVIVRDGKIIAERYAPGIAPDTPLLAYSVSKSLINALIGILVRDGKLDVYVRAPVPAWSSPSDPRHAITLDELLRMTSGLNLTESDTGLDPVSRMLFRESDMAAYAESARLKAIPGTTWEYTSGNTLIASAILRDAVGGRADDVRNFARSRLFDPVGMQHVTMEFDSAGTPVGSTRFFASGRDWARFGQLYLDDGVVNGKRILPEGWVAYSAKPTLASDYGAGFWVNAGQAEDARERVQAGMPADSFYASGNLGQRIVIIPSQRLVLVRFGVTIGYPGQDIRGLLRLVSAVIAAQHPSTPEAR